MMTRKTFLTFLFAIAILGVNAQTADEIVTKYFENTGGLAKWKEIKSVKMEASAPTPQGEFPLFLYHKSPNKSKIVVNVQGKEFVQAAYDGETAWNFNPFAGTEPTKLDDDAAKALKGRQIEHELIDYKKKGHAISLEGKEEVGGVQCYKIKFEKNKLNDAEDVTEYHYFDANSFLQVMQQGYVPFGPMKGKEVQSYMSDYREVNGFKVPFMIEEKSEGNTISKIVIKKYSINEDIDDSVFAFPKK
jgi:outer membrane lipoprotein-sorting protein